MVGLILTAALGGEDCYDPCVSAGSTGPDGSSGQLQARSLEVSEPPGRPPDGLLSLLFNHFVGEPVFTMWSHGCINSFPGGSDGKESTCNEGDPGSGSIPGLGRYPGEGNGNPLQYSSLENPMDRGAWWVTVHGVGGRKELDTTE